MKELVRMMNMGNKKTTHVRIESDIVREFNREMPGVRHSDIIRASWLQYKTVQKMGKFVYGNVWNVPKKK